MRNGFGIKELPGGERQITTPLSKMAGGSYAGPATNERLSDLRVKRVRIFDLDGNPADTYYQDELGVRFKGLDDIPDDIGRLEREVSPEELNLIINLLSRSLPQQT